MALTFTDKCLIRESWAEWKKGNVVDQGVHMFLRMFNARPDLKHLWKFSDDDNTEEHYKKKPKFQYHVKRLFSTVGTMVKAMDDTEEIEPVMEDLGRRHYQYGARVEHFELVADGLLYALERALGNKWTPEVKAAWVKLYTIMQEAMTRRMNEKDATD